MFLSSGIVCVLTADFRHIAFAEGRRNGERLFRAAITAFCTLARPTRREVAQLDDLALGLYDSVSRETRRFAAGALCECSSAPRGVVRRLCDEPAEISAPLLVRSHALSDIDLIALIARHGLSHARVIARRDDLNPAIAALIKALIARAETQAATKAAEFPREDSEKEQADTLEPVRDQLRALMRDEGKANGAEAHTAPFNADHYKALLDPALSGNIAAFAAALAHSLELPVDRARNLATAPTYSDLLACLKSVQLSAEQAFLITAATYPAQVTNPSAIRLFLQRFRAVSDKAAREKVENWRKASQENMVQLPLASVR